MAAPGHVAVKVIEAGAADKPTIANLIQLYLYDMTAYLPFPVGNDGKFEYGYLEQFWRYPYLIYCGDKIAGFALVIDECPLTGLQPCFFMAEFFILKAYRRQGIGRKAMEAIFDRCPGTWHIGVISKNVGAGAFWSRILSQQDAGTFRQSFDGEEWLVYKFDS